ncbi:hypothetical protein [Clostridium sp.]|uniref:hypothetical protein n=1 Tax=Clostridium sp. TaxID=1506 RepID=UPI00261F33EE|nr:hypothetical protein [uncultured Clostridium sp.]
MSEQIIPTYKNVNSSFFKKTLFYFKVNKALKDCKTIESILIKNKDLKKKDSSINLIMSNGSTNEVDDSYLVIKPFNESGSISPLIKYTFINGEIEKYFDEIKRDIIIVDLYEDSLYLHSFTKTNLSITGYLIKVEVQSEINKTLIFTNQKVKIDVRNTNKFETINVFDDFINSYII